MELRGKYTLFAEGARGSLTKQILAKYALDKNSEPQKFGIGFKELWRIKKEKHKAGLVQHSFGWPLDPDTGGGSFLYHFDEDLVSIGFVVHLNYSNPTLSPFDEFQRFKAHPKVCADAGGGRAALIWRARLDRRRLAERAQTCVSRRRADRLHGGLHECPAHQGFA